MARRPRIDPSVQLQADLDNRLVTLKQLFVDDQREKVPGEILQRMLRRARYKVIQGFRHAVDMKRRPTDNFIVDCGPTVRDLAERIAFTTENARVRLVQRRDLAPPYRNFTDMWHETVAEYAGLLLLERVIDEVVTDAPGREARVWYMRGDRTWQARQSLMDEWGGLCREAYGLEPSRPKRATKADTRPFHGRPGRDRSRNRGLGVAPGVSVGTSR